MPKENSKVLKERERELPLGERRISHFFGPFNGSGVVVFSGCDFYSKGKRREKETWEQEFSHRMTLSLIYLHLRWKAGKPYVYNRVYMIYMYICICICTTLCVYIFHIYHTCLPLCLASKASKMGYKFIWIFFRGKGRSFCWESNLPFKKLQPPSSGTFHSSSTS